jgi:hypothetical protein
MYWMEMVHLLVGERSCTGWECLCIEWRGLMYLMEKVNILDEEGSYICWRGSM